MYGEKVINNRRKALIWVLGFERRAQAPVSNTLVRIDWLQAAFIGKDSNYSLTINSHWGPFTDESITVTSAISGRFFTKPVNRE